MFSRKQDDTPGGLAAELADSAAQRKAAVAAAEQAHADTRESVIQRGVERISSIQALEAELADEREALAKVVDNA